MAGLSFAWQRDEYSPCRKKGNHRVHADLGVVHRNANRSLRN